MPGPGEPNLLLALLMLLTATYHATNLARSRNSPDQGDARAETTHLVMGLAMALMLVHPLTRLTSVLLIVVFLVPFGWFGARSVALLLAGRGGQSMHRLQHCLLCAAMLAMLLTGTRAPMPLMRLGAPDASLVSAPVLALVAALLALVVWNVDQAALVIGPPARLAVTATASCRIVTGLTMSYVLLAMS